MPTDILNALVLLANFVLIPALSYGSQLALGALGVTLVYAVLRFSNFAHGDTMAFGAMVTILATWWLQSRGMAFVPQTANVFVTMTVQENLEMGAYLRTDDFTDTMEQVFALFPVLAQKRRQPAGELSGGQRQQVAVGRALMTRPSGADVGRADRRRVAHRDGRVVRPNP